METGNTSWITSNIKQGGAFRSCQASGIVPSTTASGSRTDQPARSGTRVFTKEIGFEVGLVGGAEFGAKHVSEVKIEARKVVRAGGGLGWPPVGRLVVWMIAWT